MTNIGEQFTPDEARRYHLGKTIDTGGVTLYERLKNELHGSCYDEDTRQYRAIYDLLHAWESRNNTETISWFLYMEQRMKSAFELVKGEQKTVENILRCYYEDLGFWVRALAVSPAFKEKPYADWLRGTQTKQPKRYNAGDMLPSARDTAKAA